LPCGRGDKPPEEDQMDKKIVTIGTFGAALTAMGIAPELQADIIDLSFTPATNPYVPFYGTQIPIDINEIGGAVDFSQWNDTFGKTMTAGVGSLSSITVVGASITIDPGTFLPGNANIGFGVSSSGTVYIGFRLAGNVGWFSLNLGGQGGDIHYLDGQYGSMGEAVHVGSGAPAPGGLALLALRAAGVRRNRKRTA
jgi:hypothetical protein